MDEKSLKGNMTTGNGHFEHTFLEDFGVDLSFTHFLTF